MIVRRLAVVAAIVALTCAACWTRQKVVLGDAHKLPPAESLVLPDMQVVKAQSDTVTEVAMRNVYFHIDDDLGLNIRELRGRLSTVSGDRLKILDDKKDLALEIEHGQIALTEQAVSILLNRYVFGYRGSPLKDLVVHTKGNRIVQTGVMHKLIDIPFEMEAQLSLTDDGLIRLHPIRMDICGLDGQKLLKAVGRDLGDLLDLKGAKGARVVGNDLVLDPLKSLPPPVIRGRMTDIRVEGREVVQVFGAGSAADPDALKPPVAAQNYIFFRGGPIRFGKLFMALSDLMAIDGDDTDPFDFYLDYYHTQLVAGYHVTMPDYALVAWMPDFDDLGSPKGKVAPPPLKSSH